MARSEGKGQCWEYWDISVETGLRVATLYKIVNIRHHHEKLLQAFLGQLSFTIEDRSSFQYFSI
jgi:hypothetical protein